MYNLSYQDGFIKGGENISKIRQHRRKSTVQDNLYSVFCYFVGLHGCLKKGEGQSSPPQRKMNKKSVCKRGGGNLPKVSVNFKLLLSRKKEYSVKIDLGQREGNFSWPGEPGECQV